MCCSKVDEWTLMKKSEIFCLSGIFHRKDIFWCMCTCVCVKIGLCGTKMVGLLECKNCSWPFHSVGHFCAGENYSRKKSYKMGVVDKKIPKCITASKNSYAHQALQHRFNSTAEQ